MRRSSEQSREGWPIVDPEAEVLHGDWNSVETPDVPRCASVEKRIRRLRSNRSGAAKRVAQSCGVATKSKYRRRCGSTLNFLSSMASKFCTSTKQQLMQRGPVLSAASARTQSRNVATLEYSIPFWGKQSSRYWPPSKKHRMTARGRPLIKSQANAKTMP